MIYFTWPDFHCALRFTHGL